MNSFKKTSYKLLQRKDQAQETVLSLLSVISRRTSFLRVHPLVYLDLWADYNLVFAVIKFSTQSRSHAHSNLYVTRNNLSMGIPLSVIRFDSMIMGCLSISGGMWNIKNNERNANDIIIRTIFFIRAFFM